MRSEAKFIRLNAMSAMMKKTLVLFAFALALTGSAMAEDLAGYDRSPPLWTGFYVGLNAGYFWSGAKNNWVSTTPIINPVRAGTGAATVAEIVATSAARGSTAIVPTCFEGFIGGGQIGYNQKFGDYFIAGMEADIQGIAGGRNSAIGWSASPLPPTPLFWRTSLSTHSSIDFLGTVRGRLGWLITPTLLAYGAGGLAYGGVTMKFSVFQKIPGADPPEPPPLIGVSAYADTHIGWTAGGGLEWLFLPNWSAKVEYLYYDLGSAAGYASMPFVAPDPNGGLAFINVVRATTRFDGRFVRAGVNYHLDWSALSTERESLRP
jgi:outer membrane immunogenic protein